MGRVVYLVGSKCSAYYGTELFSYCTYEWLDMIWMGVSGLGRRGRTGLRELYIFCNAILYRFGSQEYLNPSVALRIARRL